MSEDHDFTPPDANECGGYYCSPEHGHIDCNPIMVARVAILLDLRERFKAGDKTVKPLDKANEHRWNKPQLNYFSGRGEIDCPICKTGKLRYSRAGYNGQVHARCSSVNCVAWME